jgi:hypothetical protein
VSQKCPECWGQGSHAPHCNGLAQAYAEGRAEALEEAAQVVEVLGPTTMPLRLMVPLLTERIRALASKPQ